MLDRMVEKKSKNILVKNPILKTTTLMTGNELEISIKMVLTDM
jgi:hypothetical protein